MLQTSPSASTQKKQTDSDTAHLQVLSSAQVFKALSEEIRLRIIGLLLCGELCVCDLMAILDLPQSTISRHLAYLKNTGWVRGRRSGVWMYYKIIKHSDPLLAELFTSIQQHIQQLAQVEHDQKALYQFHVEKNKNSCG